MQLKIARKLMVSCSVEVAAMPILSTYCAYWSALITESKLSRIKLEKADRDLLRPSTSLRYAKLNASISTNFWSVICNL